VRSTASIVDSADSAGRRVAEIQANLAGEHRQGRWFESTIRKEHDAAMPRRSARGPKA